MNAERLHKIINELKTEFDKIKLVNKITELRDHLQNGINQPQQPEHQQNLVKVKKEVYDFLEKAPSNDFSPIWKQNIDEIGGWNIIGQSLKKRLEEIFSRNQITPSSALDEINIILKELQTFNDSINQIVSGFTGMKIGKEELQPGECEVSYLIPRLYTNENLESLKKEVAELNFILSNISEVATGKKEKFKVTSISSSDYLFYIIVSLLVGNILVIATGKILNTYKSILEIKKLRNELKEKGVPDKETKGIEEYANKTMEKEIFLLAKEMVKRYYKGNDTGRKNELLNGLTISFNKIANRIDNGFNIDVCVESLPKQKEEEAGDEHKQSEEIILAIKESLKSLEFINTSGNPILSLKENDKE